MAPVCTPMAPEAARERRARTARSEPPARCGAMDGAGWRAPPGRGGEGSASDEPHASGGPGWPGASQCHSPSQPGDDLLFPEREEAVLVGPDLVHVDVVVADLFVLAQLLEHRLGIRAARHRLA